MSAIIHVMGRVTKDPAMQQGKNNGSEYISLDLASSQRSQNTQNGQKKEQFFLPRRSPGLFCWPITGDCTIPAGRVPSRMDC